MRKKSQITFSLWKPLTPAVLSLLTSAAWADPVVLTKKPQNVVRMELLTSSGDFADKSLAELETMIKGFQTLVRNETDIEKKAKLMLSEAGTHLAVARLKASSKRNSSVKALKLAKSLVDNDKVPAALRAKAAYYAGLAELNLNREASTAGYFKNALEFEPKSSGAPSLALYLGESYFEKGRYQDALDVMKDYTESFTDSQKALSLYKSAWCYANMGNFTAAETNFSALVDKSTPFSEDALKDLAYIVSLHRDEDQILEFAETKFRNRSQMQNQFLSEVYLNLQAQTSTKKRGAILSQLMKSERDPVRRLKLQLANLKSLQRDYASTQALQEFQLIVASLEKNAAGSGAEWKNLMADLELESFALARAYLASLSGKNKSEGLTKAAMTDGLLQILSFHLAIYPQSKDRETSYRTLVKLCEAAEKEAACGASYMQSLEKYHTTNPSSESLYHLQLARFQGENYAAVVQAPSRPGKDRFSTETQNIVREAHLRLAQKNIGNDNFAEYSKNLSEFLKMTPDGPKAEVARKDLINQYLQRKNVDAASEELLKLPPKKRIEIYGTESLKISELQSASGKFSEAKRLSSGWSLAKKELQEPLELQHKSALAAEKEKSDLAPVHQKSREYLFGVLALTEPEQVISVYTRRAPISETERKVYLLALKVSQKNLEPKLNGTQKRILGHLIESKNEKPSLIEKDLVKLVFPNAKTPTKAYETQTQTLVEKLRALRESIGNELPKLSGKNQIQLLKLAADSEEKTAKVVLAAPAPAGLNKSQAQEYKKGLADLASEFTKQASEYNKIRASVEKSESKRSTAALPFPTDSSWSLPRGELSETLNSMLQKRSYTAALLMLDQRRSANSIDPETYFQARAKVLFSMPQNPAVSSYFAGELQELGQGKMLTRWENLVAGKEKR